MTTWPDKLRDTPCAEGTPAARAIGRIADELIEFQKHAASFFPAGFADRLLDYLLTGEPLAVFGEARALEWMTNRLQVAGRLLYEHFADLPPEVALRWARLLATPWAARLATSALCLPDGGVWPEALMLHACSEAPGSFRPDTERDGFVAPYRAHQLEAMLGLAGVAPDWLLVRSFATPLHSSSWQDRGLRLLRRAGDYADALDRHLESVRPFLLADGVAQRLHVIALLEPASPAALARLAPELAGLATSSSKLVRQSTAVLLRRGGDAVAQALATPLRRLATQGAPEPRQHALRLLMAIALARGDAETQAFARATATADKAPAVCALLGEWQRDAGLADDGANAFELPRVDTSAAANPVDDATLATLWSWIDGRLAKHNQHVADLNATAVGHGRQPWMKPAPAIDAADRDRLRDYLRGDALAPPQPQTRPDTATVQIAIDCLRPLLPTLPFVAALKLAAFFGFLAHDRQLTHAVVDAVDAMHAKAGRPTLIELDLVLAQMGVPSDQLLRAYGRTYGRSIAATWGDEAVWPFFAHHVDLLEKALLEPPKNDWYFDRGALFRAIATLPRPPASLVDALFALALGTAKADRQAAQDALAALPGKEPRIAAALADGKAEVRTVAAQWLGRLKAAGALGALEAAVAKEKHDVAKGALLDALQALGQPVERYIDRATLAKEAPKALAKGIPADLGWFPWDALPAVHWADDGQPVPADVLRWLLVQAVKQKSPEPNAVLRKLCALFDAGEREAFGQFVLEVWLHEDVKPDHPDAARDAATRQAQQVHHSMTTYPKHFAGDPNLGKSVEQLAALYLGGFLRQPIGSAIGSKGLLAVAAACAQGRAAAPVQRYLKEWYGTRAAQGRALIAMLAWIEHPSATQLMLAVGNRFRTKSFQEEATKQAEALAERKGWSLAELADRTMPSAGFEGDGTLALSFGERVFTARLLPDFKIELLNPEGRKIAALPEPRQDDDAEAAAAAKKALAAAKKEVKSIVALQSDRLYEALCTQRDWPAADWRTYILGHPVVRHLAQRLVWCERDADGRVLRSFRPLDDGTLTDRDDDPVVLAEDARVAVVHGSQLAGEDGAAWQRHLADYEIAPLFVQFGKQPFALAPERAGDDRLLEFEGHLLEAFALRGRALKLGWTRGAPGDGGWFTSYDKRFASLGLEATIEFTGNPLPEQNRTVALISLSFSRTDGHAANARIALGKVPPVLLAECRDDLRLVAAEGSGFDAEWERKSEYQ